MRFTEETLDFSGKTESEIQEILAKHQLTITPGEAQKIQDKILKRPPSLAECVLWSIQGSEHCSYKTSRHHLKNLPTEGPNVLLGPSEDAGIITLATDDSGRRWGLALSHESHNHPSQVVPYEGAATGVGGNVRDITCMGARVVAVADALRFGNPSDPRTRWVMDGVIDGIGGYGNPLGIPNLGGDVFFHEGYQDNCLVTVLTLGVLCEDHLIHSYAPADAEGYHLILVGKPTDRSGFGGASFASLELEEDEREKNTGAVQEPNAFLERHLLKSTYALVEKLAKEGLISRVGFKDLGAGGIACASVELADAAGYGAEVDLDKVPVAMEGLPDAVVLCAETQERFMWVADDATTQLILEHYNHHFDLPGVSEGARAAVVGKITTDGQYRVHRSGHLLVDAPAAEVTRGLMVDRPYVLPQPPALEAPPVIPGNERAPMMVAMLRDPNLASRAPVYESYDKQVQGGTLLEPGQAGAGVFMPFNSPDYPEEIREIRVAMTMDHNPWFCQQDPRKGTALSVLEAFTNLAATGAYPEAITDCLCFGNPEKPPIMGQLVASLDGMKEACESIHLFHFPDAGVPIVAGNVSLYNESRKGAIPPSPIIGAVGQLPPGTAPLASALVKAGNPVYLLGERKGNWGGSQLARMLKAGNGPLPETHYQELEQAMRLAVEANQKGYLASGKDISLGGAGVALARMAQDGGLGFEEAENSLLTDPLRFFEESPGLIFEVDASHEQEFLQMAGSKGLHANLLGKVIPEPQLVLRDNHPLPHHCWIHLWENGLRDRE